MKLCRHRNVYYIFGNDGSRMLRNPVHILRGLVLLFSFLGFKSWHVRESSVSDVMREE